MTITTTFKARMATGAAVDVAPVWCGVALAVHPPIRDGVATTTRGVWVISAMDTGYTAGTFRGPKRDAVKLATLWDAAFAAALCGCNHADGRPDARRVSLADWPQRRAWSRQVSGDAPATGPVAPDHPDYSNGEPVRTRPDAVASDGDGGDQFPATLTMTPSGPGRVRYARRLPDGRERLRNPETGKPVRMNGDVAAFKTGDPLTPRLRLWFRGVWFDVPTIAQCMEWSVDGVAETPDGSRVEPDAPDSWLTLLGVV
jgi:hypothetical protein